MCAQVRSGVGDRSAREVAAGAARVSNPVVRVGGFSLSPCCIKRFAPLCRSTACVVDIQENLLRQSSNRSTQQARRRRVRSDDDDSNARSLSHFPHHLNHAARQHPSAHHEDSRLVPCPARRQRPRLRPGALCGACESVFFVDPSLPISHGTSVALAASSSRREISPAPP